MAKNSITTDKVRSMTAAELGVQPFKPAPLTRDQEDLIIAALRLWQNVADGRMALIFPDGGPAGLDYFEEISTCNGLHSTLTVDEIDTLLDDGFAVA